MLKDNVGLRLMSVIRRGQLESLRKSSEGAPLTRRAWGVILAPLEEKFQTGHLLGWVALGLDGHHPRGPTQLPHGFGGHPGSL